jgi:hypothetical protein
MRKVSLIAAVFFAVAWLAVAEDGAPSYPRPKGVLPQFATVSSIDPQQNALFLETVTTRVGAVILAREEERNGKVVRLTQTIYKPVYETQVRPLALETAEVFEAGGKKLSSEEIWKRVAVGATVLVSVDGQPVDSASLRTLAKDTLIFMSQPYADNAPTRPIYEAPPKQPALDPADDEPERPTAAPRPIYDPTNPDPAYHLSPAANNWQIHRTDSETLLLNTSTGETWILDKSGDRQYKWQRIARDGAPPPPARPPVLGQPPQPAEGAAEPPRPDFDSNPPRKIISSVR